MTLQKKALFFGRALQVRMAEERKLFMIWFVYLRQVEEFKFMLFSF